MFSCFPEASGLETYTSLIYDEYLGEITLFILPPIQKTLA